jgi:DNA invertase Pin-like site-specific DNA recombinase
VYTDIASGVKTARPGLEQALDKLRKGDTLVVWKLDRLGRSVSHLIDTVKSLNEKKIGFKSLQESIDTTTSGGKLVFHIFSALAEFERDLIRERTKAGLKAARARGKLGGRPPMLSAAEVKKLKRYYKKGELPVIEICKIFGISKPTLYKYVRKDAA